MKQLNFNNLLETDWVKWFTPDQRREIQDGLDQGLDVAIYAKTHFHPRQMKALKEGLRLGIPYETLREIAHSGKNGNDMLNDVRVQNDLLVISRSLDADA